MKRRHAMVLVGVLLVPTTPAQGDGPPLYEPRVVPGVSSVLPAGACVAESAFEVGPRYNGQAPYNRCERLKVVFGPIMMKPGQNDVLIQPVTFEKPFYPGYLVRFKPNLVRVDGLSPLVKDAHLHHGTWLNAGFFGDVGSGLPANPGRRYGWGPWLATGEEKTIAVWPKGYGLKILPSDSWLFLHMVHNTTPETYPVWVTYDLDFIPADAAEQVDPATGKPLIANTKGIWLDVGDCDDWTEDGCEKDSFNPVFNIQRGHGLNGECVFPRQNCSAYNTYGLGETSTQQGIDKSPVFDEWTVPEGGTLMMMGGHLHFGGLRDEVSLGRDLNGDGKFTDDEWRLIHISDALYWDQLNVPAQFDSFDLSRNVVGDRPTSWDMVMTGVSKDLGWSVQVKKGDKLRLEGVYDSTLASWQVQMGIVMSWLAPGDTSGLDPFAAGVSIEKGLNTQAVNPPTVPGYSLPGSEFANCTPGPATLCVRGQATHARIATSATHWSCESRICEDVARTAPDGALTRDIMFAGFTFGEADFGVIELTGVPRVKVNTPVTFWNLDTAGYMWHSATRCANPCSGSTSASYPLADGAWDDRIGPPPPTITDPRDAYRWTQQEIKAYMAANGPDPLDFDSGDIGIGTGANQKVSWTLTPTRTGTYTFFCRIHPGMRGAIRVVE